jgi:VCBS repeat protein
MDMRVKQGFACLAANMLTGERGDPSKPLRPIRGHPRVESDAATKVEAMFLLTRRLLLAAALIGAAASVTCAAPAISFLPPVSYTMTGASGITAVDLDGDGKLDLLVGDISSGRLSLMYGRGDGTFEPPVEMQLGNGYEPALSVDHQIVAADVNGDGLPDLIVPQNALARVHQSRASVVRRSGCLSRGHAAALDSSR